MFSKKDEEYLIRRLSRNDVVLFLGAGFSLMADNALKEKLPTGKQFAQKIWDFLGYTDDYTIHNTPLPTMYQALLTSGKSYPEIEKLLTDNFIVKSFPEIYNNITIPFWYKIYSVNIDNLVEKIYFSNPDQKLQILKYPHDEYKERDQTLESLQAIFLHGKLICKPNEVIFSRQQYAGSTLAHQPLYYQFVNDYSTMPTIFIGTSLDEPIFDQYIAARQSRRSNIAENRPKCFLIDPFISPIQENIYRNTYNIEPIKATTEEFLNWIASIAGQLNTKLDTLKIVLPSLNQLLTLGSFKESYRENINDFSQSFKKVRVDVKYNKASKAFLLGTSPTWADIFSNLDASRLITVEIFNYVEEKFNIPDELNCIAILGTAGSGKSTVLKRLSYALAKNGRSVYYSNSESMPNAENLFRTLEMLNEKVILAFDNAELVLSQLSPMLEKICQLKHPPVILLAARTNVFDKISNRIMPLTNLKEFFMPNLVREEIIRIIQILEVNNLLGYLKGLSSLERIKEFENRAKKQILIAMREATNGKDFDEIIKSEFNQIEPYNARLLCLCVAITTDAGFTISKQDFVSFSSETPAIVLDFLERTLKDIVIKAGPKSEKLYLRHRLIAGYIIENCVDPKMLKDAYIKVLSSLANEINNTNRNPRKFTLYIEIINHYTIFKRFSKNIEQAREVYESLAAFFNDDFQFWLQYGSLESEGQGGDLQLAENYLNQAYSLRPKNVYVKNAIANLFYKKATLTNSSVEAIEFKEVADKLLSEIMSDKYSNDPYTYYIYAQGGYRFALKWAYGDRDKLNKHFSGILKVIKQATELYPNDKKLKTLKDNISKALLLTVVDDKNVQYPIIFNDSDSQPQ